MAAICSPSLPFELQYLTDKFATARTKHDQEWILALIQKQGRLVVGLLWRMLGSEQDALDAYQSTICRLISQGQEAIGNNKGGYFYRAAMNAGIETLRMRQRRQKHWPAVLDFWSRRQPECDLSGELEVDDERRRLRHAITQLPPHLRDVVVLRELAGLPYRKIAAILQIGAATARLYRHQAILRLGKMLK
jgi:RNA polymerase sigma-70 factor (ECF subfamily)